MNNDTVTVLKLSNGEYTLLKDVIVDGISIPAGFCCDLCSVLWLVSFNQSKRAGLLHDYGYRRDLCGCRKDWDQRFRRILIKDGVTPWKAWLMYYAVRMFSWYAWNKVRRNKVCGS